MANQNLRIALFMALPLVVSCTSTKVVTHETKGPDPLEVLPELAVEIRDELRILAKSRDMQARAQLTPAQAKSYQDELFARLPGFEQRITIDTTSRPEDVAKLIATAAGYDFVPPKTQPPVPFVVTMKLVDVTLYEALRALNAKIGKAARLVVHTQPRRVIHFEYATQ